MNASRRKFFQHTLYTGALAGLFTARPSLAESVLNALQQADEGAPPEGEHDSKSFWISFVPAAQASSVTGVHGRGFLSNLTGSKKQTTGAAEVNRQLDCCTMTRTRGFVMRLRSTRASCLNIPAIPT